MLTSVVRIVDDEESVRDSRRFLLELEGFQVAVFESAESFLQRNDEKRPGCLVLDLRMPGMSGLELQAELARRGRSIPILFISGHADVDSAVLALKNGAFDFIQKPVMPERLIDAVRKLVAYSEEAEARDALTASARGKISGLTPREMTIARLVISGAQNKAIAEELGLAEQSVKIYRSHVCQKLEVKNAVELGELFRTAGLADEESPDGYVTGRVFLK